MTLSARLVEIAERIKNARNLPWRSEWDGGIKVVRGQDQTIIRGGFPENSDLVAHAPEDLAFLLAQVAKLDRANAERDAAPSDLAFLLDQVAKLEAERDEAKADAETYARAAEKYGDLSCCYDAGDVMAVVARAFEDLRAQLAASEARERRLREALEKIADEKWPAEVPMRDDLGNIRDYALVEWTLKVASEALATEGPKPSEPKGSNPPGACL